MMIIKKFYAIRLLNMFITAFAVLMTGVQLLTYAAGMLPAMQQRTLFLGFVLSLILLIQIRSQLVCNQLDLWCFFLFVVTLISCGYIFLQWHSISLRLMNPTPADLAAGICLLASVITCTTLRLGLALPVIAASCLLYALLGHGAVGEFSTGYFPVWRVTAHLTMETSGIFGMVLGTAAKYIFIFIIFGAFLECSGASIFFLELTNRMLGNKKGSGAKVEIMSSGMFGMISGSAAANVMATAPMTIPIMRQHGFDTLFSGAVSSIAGTGGQLMPPIMGTAAFIIAETLAVSYHDIAKSALLPGILFYLILWVTINLRCNHKGITGNTRSEDWRPMVRKGVFYITPILFLIITISFLKWSPIKAGLQATALIVILSWFNRENTMDIRNILKAMEQGAYNSLTVGTACAAAGIIIGVLSLTGIGIRFSGLLITCSGGYLLLLLLFTMAAGIILGMGMTTTSVYIVLSVLVAPALVSFGIKPIAAHLFVFYFGILSCITPPVATAAYAAASIAGESPLKLACYTVRVALPIYFIPFLFVLHPSLLFLEGTFLDTIWMFFAAVICLCSIAAAVEGCLKRKLNGMTRVILAILPICMLQSNQLMIIVSVLVCASLLLYHYNMN